MVREVDIVEFLKDNLDVLEAGLQLMATELYLPNQHGSRGSVDLLAKDSDGRHVAIEVKATRSASREALQELAKYAELLSQGGLSAKRLRCFLVAADWSELHAPFSQLKKGFPCELTGYQYEIGPSGLPENFEMVKPRPSTLPLDLSPFQFAILVREEPNLASELRAIERKLTGAGVLDYVVFDFIGKSNKIRGAVEHLLYFAYQAITPEMTLALASTTGTSIEENGTPTRFGRWEYAVHSLLAGGRLRDDVADGTPSELVRLVAKYRFRAAHKYGRIARVAGLWSDEELLLEAIRIAYAERDPDRPPPRNLLELSLEHHRWDIEL